MAENNNKMVANAEFEKEKNVGLNMDQLSYICDYCGKVNQIGAPRCIRCGKRRPRNEYINAMNKVKTSKTLKAEYLEEQGKIEADKKDVANQQIVRLVESRVADEKESIFAQENLRVEQEREAIKKSTARDAVLRIIAAEKVAEDKVRDAEARAEEAAKGRGKEIDSIIEEEKGKVLEVAAQKVVAARAGIEEAAREQIEANKKIADKYVSETLTEERDKAERNAARRAVLQIIAAEKAADEKVKSSKDALQQAAIERIVEERILADKEASTRYLAEKQAIERAADERIKAEKETLKKLLEDKQMSSPSSPQQYNSYQYPQYNMSQQQPQNVIQPLTIVPYLNSNQPVYQYKPNQVYKFVPRQQASQETMSSMTNQANAGYPYAGQVQNTDNSNKSKKEIKIEKAKLVGKPSKAKVRLIGLLCILIAAAILALGVLKINLLPLLAGVDNIDIIYSMVAKLGVMTSAVNVNLIVMAGYSVFLVFTALALIQNLIRLLSGKASKVGFIIPLLALIGIIVALVGLFINIGITAVTAIGPIAFAILGLMLFIFTIIGGIKTKTAK